MWRGHGGMPAAAPPHQAGHPPPPHPCMAAPRPPPPGPSAQMPLGMMGPGAVMDARQRALTPPRAMGGPGNAPRSVTPPRSMPCGPRSVAAHPVSQSQPQLFLPPSSAGYAGAMDVGAGGATPQSFAALQHQQQQQQLGMYGPGSCGGADRRTPVSVHVEQRPPGTPVGRPDLPRASAGQYHPSTSSTALPAMTYDMIDAQTAGPPMPMEGGGATPVRTATAFPGVGPQPPTPSGSGAPHQHPQELAMGGGRDFIVDITGTAFKPGVPPDRLRLHSEGGRLLVGRAHQLQLFREILTEVAFSFISRDHFRIEYMGESGGRPQCLLKSLSSNPVWLLQQQQSPGAAGGGRPAMGRPIELGREDPPVPIVYGDAIELYMGAEDRSYDGRGGCGTLRFQFGAPIGGPPGAFPQAGPMGGAPPPPHGCWGAAAPGTPTAAGAGCMPPPQHMLQQHQQPQPAWNGPPTTEIAQHVGALGGGPDQWQGAAAPGPPGAGAVGSTYSMAAGPGPGPRACASTGVLPSASSHQPPATAPAASSPQPLGTCPQAYTHAGQLRGDAASQPTAAASPHPQQECQPARPYTPSSHSMPPPAAQPLGTMAGGYDAGGRILGGGGGLPSPPDLSGAYAPSTPTHQTAYAHEGQRRPEQAAAMPSTQAHSGGYSGYGDLPHGGGMSAPLPEPMHGASDWHHHGPTAMGTVDAGFSAEPQQQHHDRSGGDVNPLGTAAHAPASAMGTGQLAPLPSGLTALVTNMHDDAENYGAKAAAPRPQPQGSSMGAYGYQAAQQPPQPGTASFEGVEDTGGGWGFGGFLANLGFGGGGGGGGAVALAGQPPQQGGALRAPVDVAPISSQPQLSAAGTGQVGRRANEPLFDERSAPNDDFFAASGFSY